MSLTAKSQLEEESLVVEPDMPYNVAKSHRLEIYNEAEGSHQRKVYINEISNDDLRPICYSPIPATRSKFRRLFFRGRARSSVTVCPT